MSLPQHINFLILVAIKQRASAATTTSRPTPRCAFTSGSTQALPHRVLTVLTNRRGNCSSDVSTFYNYRTSLCGATDSFSYTHSSTVAASATSAAAIGRRGSGGRRQDHRPWLPRCSWCHYGRRHDALSRVFLFYSSSPSLVSLEALLCRSRMY
jgi:hypothetical protein